MRNGDIIYKQQIEYKSPGSSGENIVWDFSSLKPINYNYQVLYQTTNDSCFTGTEHRTMYKYIFRNDSLFMQGYENPLTKLENSEPELLMIFPFSYKMKAVDAFSGAGRYSEKILMAISGESSVNADSYGILLLPNNDILNNVVRTQTIKIAKIQLIASKHQLNNDSIITQSPFVSKTDSSQTQKEEIYRWYAQGYRYPIFETITDTFLKDDKVVNSFSTSFYYSPEEQKYLNEDNENLALREQNSMKGDKTNSKKHNGNILDKDIISYEVRNNSKNSVEVEYYLNNVAIISMILTDVQGRIMAQIPEKRFSLGHHKESIDCSDLQPGEYILCLTANSNNYSSKIMVYNN